MSFDWSTVGGSPTMRPAFPEHTFVPPTAAHAGHQRPLVDSTPTQMYSQPQPTVLIDPSILHDRMSTIDLSTLTTNCAVRRGSPASSTPSLASESSSESSSSGWSYKPFPSQWPHSSFIPEDYSDKVGYSWAHDVTSNGKVNSERRRLLSSSFTSSQMADSTSTTEYTLSSNPPNPKTSFRLGDWICPSPSCAAHNFGRNLSCIGCGCPRSSNPLPPQVAPNASASRPTLSSPRFTVGPINPTTYYSSGPTPPQQHLTIHQQQQTSLSCVGYPNSPSSPFRLSPSPSPANLPHPSLNQHKPPHPLLTPSGRTFAVGGKVQNVSTDPLNPCIMYWPDNEALPDQGQIRPSGLVGISQPPILNTGNRGPISHQPGDWICQKCNYLNWRRRKVCQTCLPYAEGNGDSISAAVQAERIALLTNVLSQTRLDSNNCPSLPVHLQTSQHQVPRSHSHTPPQLHERRSFIDISASSHPHLSHSSSHAHSINKPVHRSRSHYALGQQYNISHPHISQHAGYLTPSPIYQTPQPQRQPSPLLYSTGPDVLTRCGVSPAVGMSAGNGSGLGVLNSGPFSGQQRGFDNVNAGLHVQAPAPAPLLPSFLQDMVQSPALSPTSTTASSVELSSADENDELASPTSSDGHSILIPLKLGDAQVHREVKDIKGSGLPRSRVGSGSSSSASSSSLMGDNLANIWRLDGEETKSFSPGFALPGPKLSAPVSLPVPVGAERKKGRAGL